MPRFYHSCESVRSKEREMKLFVISVFAIIATMLTVTPSLVFGQDPFMA
jgi:hypothetical protein